MGREACHTFPQILPCEAPSRREAPLPVPSGTLHSKKELLSLRTKALFSCHVNPMDQFSSWWHKTVTQRSGRSFEARSSGASSHFVPLHHDPATRSRCRSEETPRPAKRPRRKAGARAKRGVSELVPVAGLEPARHRWRWILSPLRLPIPSHRHRRYLVYSIRRKNSSAYLPRDLAAQAQHDALFQPRNVRL